MLTENTTKQTKFNNSVINNDDISIIIAEDSNEIMDDNDNNLNNNTLMYSTNLCHEVKLLKIINQHGLPLYAYQEIINWAQGVCASLCQFEPQHKTYKQAIQHLEKMFYLQNCRPQNIPVKLHVDQMELNVVTFSVAAMLESLFSDSKLNKLENLVVNSIDHFGKYGPPNGRLGEVNSGQWYQTAYSNCIKNENIDFLCPLILASDKTTLSEMGDLHVDAIFMTTSLFNYQVSIYDSTCYHK